MYIVTNLGIEHLELGHVSDDAPTNDHVFIEFSAAGSGPDAPALSHRVLGPLDDVAAFFQIGLDACRQLAADRADAAFDASVKAGWKASLGVVFPVLFVANGEEWSAKRAADKFIADHGWSAGPSDTTGIRAVMFGSYQVSKWKYLTPGERAGSDAYLVGGGRHGDATLTTDQP